MGFYTLSFATAQVNNVFCDKFLEIIVFHPCFKYMTFTYSPSDAIFQLSSWVKLGAERLDLFVSCADYNLVPTDQETCCLSRLVYSFTNSMFFEGTFKCKRARCRICPFISSIVKISGRNSCKITDPFTCISVNAICYIICSLYKKIFIGETGRRLADRFPEHAHTRCRRKRHRCVQTSCSPFLFF